MHFTRIPDQFETTHTNAFHKTVERPRGLDGGQFDAAEFNAIVSLYHRVVSGFYLYAWGGPALYALLLRVVFPCISQAQTATTTPIHGPCCQQECQSANRSLLFLLSRPLGDTQILNGNQYGTHHMLLCPRGAQEDARPREKDKKPKPEATCAFPTGLMEQIKKQVAEQFSYTKTRTSDTSKQQIMQEFSNLAPLPTVLSISERCA